MSKDETPQHPFSDRDFRDVMGSFATGVCVVTTNTAQGEAIGMTVNSFTSVSLNPPLVLVCLGEESLRTQAIINAARFNISVLTKHQKDISNHFAAPGQGLAGDNMVRPGDNGMPFVPNSAAVIECDVHAKHPAGDHIIIIGHVTSLQCGNVTEPLMYFQSSYKTIGAEV